MNTPKKYKIAFILTLIVVNYCQSQDEILPKVRIKLDSLYPNASINKSYRGYANHNTQVVEIKCNCPETSGKIVIWFDVNGNLQNKDIYFDSIKDLPDTIQNYIKKIFLKP
jgi:hypothetical protein